VRESVPRFKWSLERGDQGLDTDFPRNSATVLRRIVPPFFMDSTTILCGIFAIVVSGTQPSLPVKARHRSSWWMLLFPVEVYHYFLWVLLLLIMECYLVTGRDSPRFSCSADVRSGWVKFGFTCAIWTETWTLIIIHSRRANGEPVREVQTQIQTAFARSSRKKKRAKLKAFRTEGSQVNQDSPPQALSCSYNSYFRHLRPAVNRSIREHTEAATE
jgi:hypothetical protein